MITAHTSVTIAFYDEELIRLAGITKPLPAEVQLPRASIPIKGDIVRFAGLNYQDGELAFFRVAERAHLLGGDDMQGIQLQLQLLVAHQP